MNSPDKNEDNNREQYESKIGTKTGEVLETDFLPEYEFRQEIGGSVAEAIESHFSENAFLAGEFED